MTIDLNSLQDNLVSLADLGVKKALARGAEEAEAFVSSSDVISVIIEKAMIRTRQGSPCGVGIRVVVDGKVGFAATSGLEEEQIAQIAEEAIAVARVRPLDPDFKQFPDPVKRASNDGIIDDHVVEFSEKDALNEVNKLARMAFEHDKRIRSLWGNVGVWKGAAAIANTRGIEASTKLAGINAGIYCIAVENGKQKTGSEFLVTRKLEDFSEVGTKAASRALKMLDAKPLGKSIKTTTVWENVSIGFLLGNMLKTASNARNVQEGKSYFRGKIGQKVASEIVSIVDDGQLPEGLSTQKVDAEGIPMRTTPLIEKGVLQTYLYDSYSAFRENKESSGNAKREGFEPFLKTPVVSTTNLVVKAGEKSLGELIAEVDEGVLITDMVMGIGHANTITGEFSVVAPNSFLIKNGEVVNPLEPITIAGNFFQALKDIQEVGSDTRLLPMGKIPSVVIEGLTVSG
jgi:PmbA protein